MKGLTLCMSALFFSATSVVFASLSDDLIAYWSFDATNAVDNSGNGHNGTLHGSPLPVAGMFGSAYNFNGSSDWIDAAHSSAFDLTNNLTIGAWIKYDTINAGLGSQILWYGDSNAALDPWSLQLLSGGIAQFRVDAGDGHTSLAVTTNSLSAGSWYFLVGTESSVGDLKTIKLYLDGALAASMVTNAPASYDLSIMQPNIGAINNGGLEKFDGVIDEAFVYNRALSDTEIQQVYVNSVPEPASVGLVIGGLALLACRLRRRLL